MAHVKCFYMDEDGDCCPIGPLFLETTSKKVSWDGVLLKVGNIEIRSHEWFLQEIDRTGYGYLGGLIDILYLEIDGKVLVEWANEAEREDK